MAKSMRPFLMFEGNAEAAMNMYVSVFPGAAIVEMTRYGAGEPVAEGTVKLASFSIAGQTVMCFNSPVKHAFTFTPASSLFVECETRGGDRSRCGGARRRRRGADGARRLRLQPQVHLAQ